MSTYLNNSPVIAYGDFLFKRRNAVFPIFLIALFLTFPPNTNPHWHPLLGFAICICGQMLRMAVIGFAYIKRGGLNKKVYADTLVTTGFFATCRNPLYVGNMLIFTGLLLIHGDPMVLIIGTAFFLAGYCAIIATEENFLNNKFGHAYQEYCAMVPRWLIRFERLPKALNHMVFNWRKVIYKDYTTMGNWIAQACALFAYREYASTGRASIQWLYAIFCVAILIVAIKLVKKSFPL